MSFDLFDEILSNIPARQKMLLVDTCNAGEVDNSDGTPIDTQGAQQKAGAAPRGLPVVKGIKVRGFRVNPSAKSLTRENLLEAMKQEFSDLRRSSGALVISASTGYGYSYETQANQNGFFTRALLEGLRTNDADLDGNGLITSAELRQYVTDTVPSISNGMQTPTSRQDPGVDFVLQMDASAPIAHPENGAAAPFGKIDLKPLLGGEFADYETAFGKPTSTKRGVREEKREQSTTQFETRTYQLPGFSSTVITRERMEFKPGSGSSFGIDEQGKTKFAQVRYWISLEFLKSSRPWDWHQALARVGLSAGNVTAEPDKEGYTSLPNLLFKQCSKPVFCEGVWEQKHARLSFNEFR